MVGIKGLKAIPESCGDCMMLNTYCVCRITGRGCLYESMNGKREAHCPLVIIDEKGGSNG